LAVKYGFAFLLQPALSLQIRLYPRPEQETRLNRSLLMLCQLYNDLKAEEMKRYKEEHKSTSRTRFRRLALGARRREKELQTVHSQAVQNLGDRIHRSLTNFFETRARFPRWKEPHRYNSLTYPESVGSNRVARTAFIFRASETSGLRPVRCSGR
jgi:putative transposase